MALTLTRDLRFPVPGDKVTMLGTFTVGTRFRCKLTNKPIDSALPIYEAAEQNYLDNNQWIPDVPGCYTVDGVEETVTLNVPHHSTDLGGTLKKGVEQIAPNATATHYCTVLGKATRAIGFDPDTCTIETYWGTDDYAGGTTNGAVTRFADATKCPKLVDGTSDRAKIAMAADLVARQVGEIGGYGNEAYKYGTRADQIQPIRSYDTIVDPAILTTFAWMIIRLNDHITNQAVMIHGVADAANVITSANAVLGDETTQRVLLNELLTDLALHAAIGGGGVHSTADTIATTALGLLAALPNPSTPQQRIDRALALFDIMDRHFAQKWLTLLPAGGFVHDTVADNHLDYATLYPIYDDATVVAAANAMKTEYNLHRQKVILHPANYHNVISVAVNEFLEAMPTDREGFIKAVNTAMGFLQAHVTNRQPVTGATVLYHTEVDTASRADFPGPTDFASAINTMEALDWALAQHAAKGGNVHGLAHAGMCAIRPYGTEAIHHAFRTAVTDTGTSVPITENSALARAIQCGGFAKG